jgi:hypothetical protein
MVNLCASMHQCGRWHAVSVRRTVAVVVSALVVAVSPAAEAATPYWSVAKVLRRIDGARIVMPHRRVRIVSDSTLCSGEGRSVRRDGVRLWRRFACTYTTFTRRGIDRDLDFRILVRTSTRFVIVQAHWVGALR